MTAVGGIYAAGIGGGGGYYYNDLYGSVGCTGGTGSVTISGGIVYASSPAEVYWKGYEGAPIGNGGNSGSTSATVSKDNAIVFENGAGTVYGTVDLTEPLYVSTGYSLTFAEGATLTCVGLRIEDAVAIAEKEGAIIGCYDESNIADAFKNENSGATITLMNDVNLTKSLTISGGTFTLIGNKHTITSSASSNGAIKVISGKLDISDCSIVSANSYGVYVASNGKINITKCAITNEKSYYHSVYVESPTSEADITDSTITSKGEFSYGIHVSLGKVSITDCTITAEGEYSYGILVDRAYYSVSINGGEISGTSCGLFFYNANVTINGGKFSGGDNAIIIGNDGSATLNGTLGSVDHKPCVYYDEYGKPILLKDGQTAISGSCEVRVCKHDGVTPTDNGNDTHTLTCPYCGTTATHNSAAVNLSELTAAADEETDTVTLNAGCQFEGCGYEENSTVEFTFNDGQEIIYEWSNPDVQWTSVPESYEMYIAVDDNSEQNVNSAGSTALSTLFGTSKMTAGGHTLKVRFACAEDSTVKSNVCELPFTIERRELSDDRVTLSAEKVIYNGTEQKPTVTVSGLTENTDYTVDFDGDDFTNAGTVNITVTGTGNYIGEITKEFTIAPASPAISWSADEQTLIYTGEQAKITEPTVTLVNDEEFDGTISYSYRKSGESALTDGLPVNAGTYFITAHIDAEGNYTAADSAELTLTIEKAQGTLTVPASPIEKTYGDGEFALNCTANGDGEISYSSDNENVATVSDDGTVIIKGAGEAEITVSLGEGENYTGAAQNIGITVAKAAAPQSISETRNYTYANGSNGAVTVDVAGKLPNDRGETTYSSETTDENGILSDVAVDENGNLTFTAAGGEAGETAAVTVTAEMANYGDFTYTVNILLTEKKTVEPTGEVIVKGGNTLTYGETLSGLALDSVIFVEQGTETEVKGTLSWKDPDTVPTAGTTAAEWIFTPEDNNEYVELTGTAAIAIVKATPNIKAPTAENIVYDPSKTLNSVKLSGGSAVWIVNGSSVTVDGTWSWKNAAAVPTVKNSGYTAVFTPTDTVNYNTVECDVTVTVAKAEPYIAVPPTAAQITYGDSLNASALSGGTVQYSNSDTTAVAGSFAWKDSTIKPVVSDSDRTEYALIFTPADTANYISVETTITLTVEKAENAPNMPSAVMNVKRSCEKVSDVELPKDWQWQDADKDTVLEIGVEMNATAVYIGEDRGNYEHETAEVTITRAECDHIHTELRNVKAATCKEKGYSGDTYCTDCGELLTPGNETPLADHISDNGTVTKQPTTSETGERTYKCTVCGNVIRTETIDKLPNSGGSGTPTEPTNPTVPTTPDEPAAPSRPDNEIPFIKGENGKDGWSIIKEEIDNVEDRSTVTVDMNGAAVVPKIIFDTLGGRDVTVVFDMGDGITWSVNGKDVTAGTDIDFSVKADTGNIPVDVINNITGERYSIQISLAHNGEFGFTAVLSINLGSDNAGQKAALYYYNGGVLELMCESEISADGTARLTFTHASDYLIVIGESKTDDNESNPSTGAEVSLMPLAIAAAFISAAAKRKKK